LGGYQKLTLIDYPGKLATTVFTVGCSFRCPFCHNPELVLGNKQQVTSDKNKTEKEFFDFLRKRKGKLEGVCITGGEPTIQPDIVGFINKIRGLGYLVKLDSNGSRPDVLKKIIDGKMVDFIAMDIKNSPIKYQKTSGGLADLARIKLSVKMIMNSKIPYELRTTVVPGIHKEKDFDEIAKWIRGAEAYYLQEYREARILDPNLKKITKGKKINLEKIGRKIGKKFIKFGIRNNN
jgi:pyruvate formate lyase activating enzyme